MSIPVGIGLGSNLGDRLQHLRRARQTILALPGVVPTEGAPPERSCLSAPVYETDPVGCPPGSASFLNTVIEVGLHARCSPLHLLDALRQVERFLGRPARYPRNAPRCIDLDILYAGQFKMATSDLALPHPRLHTRRFVLAPLADIRPGLKLPGFEKPIDVLLHELEDPATVQVVVDTW